MSGVFNCRGHRDRGTTRHEIASLRTACRWLVQPAAGSASPHPATLRLCISHPGFDDGRLFVRPKRMSPLRWIQWGGA